MNPAVEEWWIGDFLSLSSSGEVGRFGGLAANGCIVFELDGIKKIVAIDDVRYIGDKPKEVDLAEGPEHLKSDTEKLDPLTYPDNIDLHIDRLNPALSTAAPEVIWSHQLSRLKSYLQGAIRAGRVEVTIVHGKGSGALRSEVEDYLGKNENVSSYSSIHQGGATQVRLK